MTKTFEEIWKEATEETDLKYRFKGTVSWGILLKEKLKSRIDPIIQQQALPVVPECVAELFNEYRFENIQRLFEFGIDDIKSNKMIKALKWRDEHPDIFALAFITGKYEVEKPQLFYLKHIDMSKHNDNVDYWFSKKGYEHVNTPKGSLPKNFGWLMGYGIGYLKFTQAEIDSMQTGSYEQIEVTE